MSTVRIHDYQLGVIRTYRNNPKIDVCKDYMLLTNDDGSKMELCYSPDAEKVCQKRDYLEKVEGSEERPETVYELAKVFQRQTYENSKKWQDKIVRWKNYFDKNELSIRLLQTAEDKATVEALYKEWCELKDLDEAMIIRYQNCINAAFDTKDNSILGIGMFNKEGKLLGYRAAYLSYELNEKHTDDNWAYDLCNFVTRNDYKYLSEVFQVNTLMWMQSEWQVDFYNLGLSDGSLRLHKKLLPSFDISYFVVR